MSDRETPANPRQTHNIDYGNGQWTSIGREVHNLGSPDNGIPVLRAPHQQQNRGARYGQHHPGHAPSGDVPKALTPQIGAGCTEHRTPSSGDGTDAQKPCSNR